MAVEKPLSMKTTAPHFKGESLLPVLRLAGVTMRRGGFRGVVPDRPLWGSSPPKLEVSQTGDFGGGSLLRGLQGSVSRDSHFIGRALGNSSSS